MLLHWYACISMNTYCYEMYYISLETDWWALPNVSLIVQIYLAVHEILENRDFTVTDDLISRLFVVSFIHPTYVQIAFIWGFTVQLSLWESVHWLWRYKLNEVCNSAPYHLSWITFTKISTNDNDHLRVITYMNVKLIGLWFLLLICIQMNNRML